MNKNKEILKINNLNVEFPLFGGILQREVSHVHAVKNLNLTVNQGETIGIVGESGSGKSTLGKAILSVLKITAPDVRVTGEILLNDNGNYIDLLKLNRKNVITNTKKFYRKIDIKSYKANTLLAKKKIKWKAKISFKQIIKKMVYDELF